MGVHVRRAITKSLQRRGVDVLTAQHDNGAQLDDPALMDRTTSLGRVLFSQDEDLLKEASRRQKTGPPFSGLVYAHPLGLTIGQAVRDLELVAQVYEPEDMQNRVEYLPL